MRIIETLIRKTKTFKKIEKDFEEQIADLRDCNDELRKDLYYEKFQANEDCIKLEIEITDLEDEIRNLKYLLDEQRQ